MPNLLRKKRPRAFHLPSYWRTRDSLEGHVSVEDAQEIAAINEVSHDLQKFLEEYCKVKPYWYLRNLIESYEKYQFNAVRWPRQTGKST